MQISGKIYRIIISYSHVSRGTLYFFIKKHSKNIKKFVDKFKILDNKLNKFKKSIIIKKKYICKLLL